MNNEPVAYVNSMCNDCIDWKAEPMSIDGQPLYTHPVKELTISNEEIEEIAKEFKDVDYTLDEEEAFDVFNHRGFARAILRKAQERQGNK